MWTILGRYGPFFLYTYTVVLGIGILLALWISAIIARRHKLERWLDGWLLAALAALVGGRLVFVWLNQAYFAENPAETWQVWRGGLNSHGALLSGLVVYWLWARITGRSFGLYAGTIAPGLAILVAAGWAACWFEGCAYGREALPGLLAANLPDDYGVYASRYQTQLAGTFLALIGLAVALWLARHYNPPVVFWGTIGLLALSHGGLALFRGDPASLLGRVRLDFVTDMVIFVISVCALIWYWPKRLPVPPGETGSPA